MKKILIATLLLSVLGYSQSIERKVIGSAGTTLTDGATASIYFTVGELVVTTITDGTTTLTQGFHQGEIQLSINLSAVAYLQGAALNPNSGETTLMRDDLRVANYIPTATPYSDGATCDVSVFTVTGTNAIVDWIWVELRDETTNTSVLHKQSALLQRDGDIVGVDGISPLSFTAATGNYYVAIKHRNHLGMMTANTVALSEATTALNFTDSANQITYGTNAQTTSGTPSGVVAMWSGDTNGDGRLNYSGALSDAPVVRTQVFNDPNNSFLGGPPVASYPSQGYYKTDINMDGITVYSGAKSDILRIRNNIFNNSSNSFLGGPPTATYIFIQQLPEGAN